MKYKFSRSLFAFLLFIFPFLSISAGVYEYTFTKEMFSKNTDSVNLGDLKWHLFSDKSLDFSYGPKNGQKIYNSQNAKFNFKLTTDDIKYKITSVSITTASFNTKSTECSVTVGNQKFKCKGVVNYPIEQELKDYVFEGNDTGTITISWKQPQKGEIYIYLKKIRITYTDSITISNAGYSTFSTDTSYTLPQGLQGGIVSVTEKTANVNFCYKPGDIIPAKEALILKGEPGKYALTYATTTNTKNDKNQLIAALTNDTIKARPGHELFILSMKNGQIGFFYQHKCPDGSYLHSIANKAYLDIPSASFSGTQHGLRLNIEPTGLSVPTSETSTKSIYLLSGKKIHNVPSALPKGLYIINGKKTFIK